MKNLTYKANLFNDKLDWNNPNCQIVDTRTGEIIKEYGVTIRKS